MIDDCAKYAVFDGDEREVMRGVLRKRLMISSGYLRYAPVVD